MNKKNTISVLLASMYACASVCAQAADISELSLEELLEVEIVSSASKMSQKVTETPAAIRVITAQDIRRYGWSTLGEALSSLPGITIVTNRYADFIGARGVVLPDDNNTRYLVLIDGTPVNDALLDSAQIGDSFPLDLALINRIEYLPGAGSAAYGANAMLGTINITTKSAKGRHATEAEAIVDSIGRSTLRLTTAQALNNGAAITLSATGMYQDGRDQTYAGISGIRRERIGTTPDGIAHDLDSGHKKQLYAKLEKDGFKLSLALSDREYHPSIAPHGANFDDPAMQISDRSFDLTANYNGEVARDITLYTNLTYMGYKKTMNTPSGLNLNVQDSDANRGFAEGRLTTTRFTNHQAAIGVDLSKEIKNDITGYRLGGATTYQDNQTDTRIGVYVQDQWRFAEDWQFHTGLRYDYSEMWGNHVSPRLGLTWQATPTVSLKAIAARAFRNPNPLEARAGINPANATVAREALSNPSLQAETVNTQELVAEWRPSNAFELSGSLYHHQLKKLIERGTLGTDFQYQNLLGIDVTGLEVATYYRFSSKWKLNASATLQHAELENGLRAPSSANWIAKLAVDGPIWQDKLQDKLYAALELYANGPSSLTWSGKPAHNSAVVTSNLVLTASNWLPKAEVQLRINNLPNRNDAVPGSDDTPVANMPLYGRNASLGVRYEF